jgi:hypothetical protein
VGILSSATKEASNSFAEQPHTKSGSLAAALARALSRRRRIPFCPGTRQRNSSSYCVSTGPPCDSKSDSIQNHPGQSKVLRSPRKPLKMDISGRWQKVFGQFGGSIPSPCTMLVLNDLLQDLAWTASWRNRCARVSISTCAALAMPYLARDLHG